MLGCGRTPHVARLFARDNGARQYIGVDKKGHYDLFKIGERLPIVPLNFDTIISQYNKDKVSHEEKKSKYTKPEIVVLRDNNQMKSILINGDILDTIGRLDDDSVNVIIFSGIVGL